MVFGHKKQIEFLNKIFFSEKIPHALMFEGLSGLGKKHLAIHYFKKINCPDKEPCNNCKNCISIEKLNHPDISLIEPKGKEIKIDQIKEISHRISLCCHSSSLKWIIIDNAHLMNKEASNSLLKVLEEPNKNTVIILITDSSESIIDTIKSRVQRIKFFPLNEKEIEFILKNLNCNDKKIKEISSFSFGIPGKAIDFLENNQKIEERKNKIKKMLEILSSKTPFYLKFEYAKKISDDSDNLKETLEMWLSYLRNLLLQKSKEGKIDTSFYKTKKFLEEVDHSIYLISKTNTNKRLIIENLILSL